MQFLRVELAQSEAEFSGRWLRYPGSLFTADDGRYLEAG